MAKPGLTHDAL